LRPPRRKGVAVDELSIAAEVVGYALGVDPAGAARAGVMGKAHVFSVHTTSPFSKYLSSKLAMAQARHVAHSAREAANDRPS
jgi:hypothetical protein